MYCVRLVFFTKEEAYFFPSEHRANEFLEKAIQERYLLHAELHRCEFVKRYDNLETL
jgi:hypothetical protein